MPLDSAIPSTSLTPRLSPGTMTLFESNALESHGSCDSTSLRIRGLPRQCLTCYVRETTWFLGEIQRAIDRPRRGSQECSRKSARRIGEGHQAPISLRRSPANFCSLRLAARTLHRLFIYNTCDSREISMETRYPSHGRHAASLRGYSANYRATARERVARRQRREHDDHFEGLDLNQS